MTIRYPVPATGLSPRADLPRRQRRRNLGLALSLSVLCSPAPFAEEALRAPMLAAHNGVRASVGVPPLDWSQELAASAQSWVDRLAVENGCRMQHSGPGENLYWASATRWSDGRREVQEIDPRAVVDSWASERRHYDYPTDSCDAGSTCGHYTQIVWRDSEAVGCAYRICPDKAQIWACQYRPAGNILGRRPY